MSQSTAWRFDSPVGTEAERASSRQPPGQWYTENPFGNFYYLGPGRTNPAIHTGADLTYWPGGPAHKPIYAVADGVVTCARVIYNRDGKRSSWGNLIVIRHVLPDRTIVHSRYGHVENMLVKPGDPVQRGQPIASVGNAFGRFAYHLHFDISTSGILEYHPEHWPGDNLALVRQHYVDPMWFIGEHHMTDPIQQLAAIADQMQGLAVQAKTIIASLGASTTSPTPAQPPVVPSIILPGTPEDLVAKQGLNVRQFPSETAPKIGFLQASDPVTVQGTTKAVDQGFPVDKGDWHWRQVVVSGKPTQAFVAGEFLGPKA